VIAEETGFGATVGIVVNGTMNVTGATFDHTGNLGSSLLQVNTGGHLMASNSTFHWSGLTLANVVDPGELTGNGFDQTVTILAVDADKLTNNFRFQQVVILGGTLSKNATLQPLGSDTQATQQYLFNTTGGVLTV